FDIIADARRRLAEIPGIKASVRDAPIIEGGTMGDAIEVKVRGADLAAMQVIARKIRTGILSIPGAADIRTTDRPGRPELRLEADRDQAAAAGLSVGQAGIALRMAVAGQVVGSLRDNDRSYDIRIRAREEDRRPDVLMSSILLLSPLPRMDDPWGRGTPVALENVARVHHDTAPTTIKRYNQQRILEITCGVEGRHLSDVEADIDKIIQAIDVPEGIDIKIGGQVESAEEALGDLLLALALAIIFVYAILASQFESFIHPFTIMLSLPLAVVGAFVTVFLMGWAIGILTMLGIILLMGLVTKNAILLVDRANQLREQGYGVREALLEAGHVRLRPILMTSLAMIFGMVPAAISTGPGSEMQQPMALPVIGGLVASTLLTLL
ncbi:MAG: efflux RND transporter permease subunit, partial [Proteobacteria bacterium]|nr:efflux RND transporter permease subunit [Pseudomonadota bacterium]